ncbi:hypothetical protein EPUS_09358 [Endocarpon pusillum Z07020]|uniref:Uncharacterized protein n=1 Tax=Endocarpon pusillum (strain Z07020 / HMAS-L-300199) TaxID=1263415 RepID=U1HT69_ENDPU|nr:uncharacterized protein EPUS_09358 [Endocarpon pusillum Z07020]ERF73760.1 hypothetical protein EPUS_09358 [Endocarpon pusillum Z07020]
MISSGLSPIAASWEHFQSRSDNVLANLQIVSEAITYQPDLGSALPKMIEDFTDKMPQIRSLIENSTEAGSEQDWLLKVAEEQKKALSNGDKRLQDQRERLQDVERELLDMKNSLQEVKVQKEKLDAEMSTLRTIIADYRKTKQDLETENMQTASYSAAERKRLEKELHDLRNTTTTELQQLRDTTNEELCQLRTVTEVELRGLRETAANDINQLREAADREIADQKVESDTRMQVLDTCEKNYEIIRQDLQNREREPQRKNESELKRLQEEIRTEKEQLTKGLLQPKRAFRSGKTK